MPALAPSYVSASPLWFGHTYVCPVCGWAASAYEGVVVTIAPFAGTYCLKCYAAWIAATFPKMVEQEDE